MKKRYKWLTYFFAAGAVLCAAAVVYMIYDFYRAEAESERKMEELREMNDRLLQGLELPESILPGESKSAAEEVRVLNPYRESFLRNEDMAAWLYIEGTKIDYPVMQTMEDEEYYVRRDFDGNADKSGCLILDTDSSLAEPITTNQIIHGHNLKAGTMFGELDKYEDADYCREHSKIKLFSRELEHNYEVIAVFYSRVYQKKDEVFKYYQFFQADTEEEFDDFYKNIKEMSLFDTGVEAVYGDCFLTLSTCSYHVKDGRFVVVAKEVEPGARYEILQRASE